jgi:hypothetical protein
MNPSSVGRPTNRGERWETIRRSRLGRRALSGLVGGALAMLAVKVSLVAFGGIAVLAALLLLVT